MTDNKDTMNHFQYESCYNEKKLSIKSQNMFSVIKSYQLQVTATGSERKRGLRVRLKIIDQISTNKNH